MKSPRAARGSETVTGKSMSDLSNLQPGDRVEADLFGAGTFQEWLCGLKGFARVLWDETPPREYCMGHNPCTVLLETLRREGDGNGEREQ